MVREPPETVKALRSTSALPNASVPPLTNVKLELLAKGVSAEARFNVIPEVAKVTAPARVAPLPSVSVTGVLLLSFSALVASTAVSTPEYVPDVSVTPNWAPEPRVMLRLPENRLLAFNVPSCTLTPMVSDVVGVKVKVPVPVFNSVPVPESVPVKLPVLTLSALALPDRPLLRDTVPPETFPNKVAVAPLSSSEPPPIEVSVTAAVTEARPPVRDVIDRDAPLANPPLNVPRTSVTALADPPLSVAICKRPLLAETVPALTPAPLRTPLPLNCVTPEPERLPNVTVSGEVNVALPKLLTTP